MHKATMSIGALRHRLVPERALKTDDGAGGALTVISIMAAVWGRIRPLRPPRRGWADGDARITHEIVLRKSAIPGDGGDVIAFRDGARRFRILGRAEDETGRWHIFLTELQP